METTQVTIRTMETIDGTKVEYACVIHQQGNRFLCRGVMLNRLTPQELAIATRVTMGA